MYKITTADSEEKLAERVTWIRKHPSGKAYLICDREKAEGCAVSGNFYLYADGVQIHEFDASELVEATKEESKKLKAQVTALTDQNDFQEELIVELANIVYA